MKNFTLVFVCAAALMASCAVPFDSYTLPLESTNNEEKAVAGLPEYLITDYDLQYYVPVPVTGAAGVTSVARPDLTVAVQWKDKDGNNISAPAPFAEGTVYQAEITLTAKAPYTFNPEKSFKYPEGSVQTQPKDNTGGDVRTLGVVTYHPARAPVPVDELELSPYILVPSGGVTAITFFAGSQYTGNVSWDPVAAGGLFQAGTAYTARVTLFTTPGHTFSEADFFTHGGSAGVEVVEKGGASVILTLSFAATSDEMSLIEIGSGLDLAVYIPAPVSNGQPVLSFAGPQYLGVVSWNAGKDTHKGLFEAGVKYTALVTLTAGSGYMFGPKHTHSGAEAVVYADSGDPVLKREVIISFPAVPEGSLTVSGISGAVNVAVVIYLSSTVITPLEEGGYSASHNPIAEGWLAGPVGVAAAIPLEAPAGGAFTGSGDRVVTLSYTQGAVTATYVGQGGTVDQRVKFEKGVGKLDLSDLTRLGNPPVSPPEEEEPPVSPPEEEEPPVSPPEEEEPPVSPPEEEDPPVSPPEEEDPPVSPPEEEDPPVSPPDEQSVGFEILW